MRKKYKVLLDLTDATGGFAGIPQESRLTFSVFAHSLSLEVEGLLTRNPKGMPRPFQGKPLIDS